MMATLHWQTVRQDRPADFKAAAPAPKRSRYWLIPFTRSVRSIPSASGPASCHVLPPSVDTCTGHAALPSALPCRTSPFFPPSLYTPHLESSAGVAPITYGV